jgi:hypothetical protein
VIKRSVYGFTSASEAENQKANTGLYTLSLYLLNMSHNSSHLRINSINFSSIFKTKQTALVASKRSKCSAADGRLFTLSQSSRHRQVRTVPSRQSFSLSDGDRTETFLSCEQLPLITHEETLLNGDVQWRNGNVTVSVNRLLIRTRKTPEYLERSLA